MLSNLFLRLFLACRLTGKCLETLPAALSESVMVAGTSHAAHLPDRREAPRDDIYYRTRAVIGGLGTVGLQIVNISAAGFMARTEAPFQPGDVLNVRLPVVGTVSAEVRWALGGRIGCQFRQMIDVARYLEMLGELVKNAR